MTVPTEDVPPEVTFSFRSTTGAIEPPSILGGPQSDLGDTRADVPPPGAQHLHHLIQPGPISSE